MRLTQVNISRLFVLILFAVIIVKTSNLSAQTAPWQGTENAWNAELSKHVTTQEILQSEKVNVASTGDFTLSVPLLDVLGRNGFDLPLAATYSPGIKVTQEASWVGLGWNLNIGSITRQTVVRMDNYIHTKPTSVFDDDEYRDIYTITCPAGSGTIIQIRNSINPSSYDFLLEQWKPWKISYDDNNHRFIVIVEDGTTYVFGLPTVGVTTNILNYTGESGYLRSPSSEPYSQWLLTAILSPDYKDGSGDQYDPLDTAHPTVDNLVS